MAAGRVIQGEVFDATKEAERIREEARREGYVAGLAEGRAAAERALLASEGELRRLAVAIAEKILRRDLTVAPDAVVEIARAAVEAVRARHGLVVRAHPDDASLLDGKLGPDVAVRPDATMPRGGCIVETEAGRLDARIETQLAIVERALCGDAG